MKIFRDLSPVPNNKLFIYTLVCIWCGFLMFLSAILGMLLWIYSERLLHRIKYPFRLSFKILFQFLLILIITTLSITITDSPETYGDISGFLPLSYPLTLPWGISISAVFPPHYFYGSDIFYFELSGGGLEFMSDAGLRAQIFIYNFPLFLTMNGTFVGLVLLLSEVRKVIEFHWSLIVNEI